MKYLTLSLCYLLTTFSMHAKEITIENEALTVRISTRGAELQSIHKKDTDREYLWNGDPKYWPKRAPIMFPVVVRFKDDAYTYQGKHYEMPTLGLVFDAQLTPCKKSASEVAFTLESSEQTLKHYPFPFRFTVTYRLEGTELINEFHVENLGDKVMYFALGGHPEFALPTSREACEVTFSQSLTVERPILDGGLIQTERTQLLNNEDRLGLTDSRIPNHGMLFVDRKCDRMGIAEKGQPPFIEVDFGDFPHTNLWTPNRKPFVCPEPLIGHHDAQEATLAIEEKAYLTELKAQSSERYTFTIIVH